MMRPVSPPRSGFLGFCRDCIALTVLPACRRPAPCRNAPCGARRRRFPAPMRGRRRSLLRPRMAENIRRDCSQDQEPAPTKSILSRSDPRPTRSPRTSCSSATAPRCGGGERIGRVGRGWISLYGGDEACLSRNGQVHRLRHESVSYHRRNFAPEFCTPKTKLVQRSVHRA